MILVKEAQGLTIELAPGPSGYFELLSIRLAGGLAKEPFLFEVHEGPDGRLTARPLDERNLSELILALGTVLANEGKILAEVRKYAGYSSRPQS